MILHKSISIIYEKLPGNYHYMNTSIHNNDNY